MLDRAVVQVVRLSLGLKRMRTEDVFFKNSRGEERKAIKVIGIRPGLGGDETVTHYLQALDDVQHQHFWDALESVISIHLPSYPKSMMQSQAVSF